MLDAARAHLATRLGVAEGAIVLDSLDARAWADTSLGCPQPGRFYAQVVTSGFRLVLSAGSARYTYHTNDWLAIPCSSSG